MRGIIGAIGVMAALATAAAGQEECLSGDATLGDQRALATLRAATDANCPCASFTGGAARRSYRRCVRQQIDAALDAGTLRPECKRTARAFYRVAVCGTNRVACGRVRNADGAVSCRLAAPSGANQCDGSARFTESACSAESFCSDVVEATAGTCVDPRERGPYNVGVRVIPMTKDSVASPGTPRTLDTVVWYPTTPEAAPFNNMYDAVLDAPVNVSGGPYPLLLFSHGSCGYAHQSTFLTPVIASYGFVVASPPHPGNTIAEFPNCATGPAQAASFQERPADIIFVTDELLAASADSGSDFFGAIDPDRIGMSGHSFGGLTTFLVSNSDPRYKIAVPMAPAIAANASLSVPSLLMLGQIDGVVNNPNARSAYQNSNQPKVKVEIEHAGHYAFSDGCFPSPDCSPPTTTTQAESHAAALRWIVPFVQRYLAGDERYESFFAVVPPGVDVEQAR